MNADIRSVLSSAFPPHLVDDLIASYQEAKENFYRGGHRLSAVEGGRFCEAAFRIIEEITTGTHTPLDGRKKLDTNGIIKTAEGQPGNLHPKSVRIHIPRSLRLIYDIRNNRNAAHLSDEIDVNLQDATLVTSMLDWVLAEFVRLSRGTTPQEAQKLIEDLMTRRVPSIQDFGGFQKVLRTDLRASDRVLVLLYRSGTRGVRYSDLSQWMPSTMRANLRRTVRALDGKALAHASGETVQITYAGQRNVESRGLLDPI
ncbi:MULTISPECIES: hypothetical protein [Streptomyces]|uniref:DUF4145 domain-containing protein n=1 Tax=Streptomyces doudnae TaxID=3075536 RepID=A0ABD5EJI0_9ACTN|nr:MULTISPECIES: hypothetical protein [unclassified Streptomyces]MDT0434460.1 hypothetical protein [Streptomyces sp. DSM 41981]MYQ69022.1 hypothetical protein [Streptomyces sp. SID4950]SCE50779.1 hypothetical protein GA0115242_143227 [Streptomyces sp. SolWspMP-5a-2]